MQYIATGYLLNKKTDATGFVASQTIVIAEARYNAVKESRDRCVLAVGLEERFQLVIDNYREWETELLSQAQFSLLWDVGHFDAMQQRLCLDRRFTNVLTAFRLYLDQTDYALSKTFGNPSPELEAIKKFKNSLYDTYFGYRFLEALRNHVQHCGLPVRIIRYSSESVETKKGEQIQFSIIPQASLDDLSANQDFKKSILNEIKSRGDIGDIIDLRPPVREFVSCLIRLHKELCSVFGDVVNCARSFYAEAVKEYSVIDGHLVQFPKLRCTDESGFVNDNIDLITDFLEVYDILHRRNSNMTDITKSCASNAL